MWWSVVASEAPAVVAKRERCQDDGDGGVSASYRPAHTDAMIYSGQGAREPCCVTSFWMPLPARIDASTTSLIGAAVASLECAWDTTTPDCAVKQHPEMRNPAAAVGKAENSSK